MNASSDTSKKSSTSSSAALVSHWRARSTIFFDRACKSANLATKEQKILLSLLSSYLFLLFFLSIFDFSARLEPSLSRELTNAGHYPAFFVGAMTLILFAATKKSPLLAIVIGLTASITLAAFIEEVQPYFGRSRSERDLLLGAAGSATAAVAMWLYYNRKSFHYWRIVAALFGTFTALLGLTFAVPLYQEFQAIQLRDKRFPILSDFSYSSEFRLWKSNNEDYFGRRASVVSPSKSPMGEYGMEIGTVPNRYSGITYTTGGQDWTSYQNLELRFYNPGHPFVVSLRVDDDGDCSKYEDRYTDSFLLGTGEQSVQIPLEIIKRGNGGRELNLSNIQRLTVFINPMPHSIEFMVTDARLS